MTMFSIPTTWRPIALNIDMIEIMTSLHPMYSMLPGNMVHSSEMMTLHLMNP